MSEVQLTAEHLRVLATVLSRAPTTLAEQMVIESLFVALERHVSESGSPEGDEEDDDGRVDLSPD